MCLCFSQVFSFPMQVWQSLSRANSFWPPGLYSPWNSPGQNTGVLNTEYPSSLFQGIFPTQGSNPGLPYCRPILYQLSHKGSLKPDFSLFFFFTKIVLFFISFCNACMHAKLFQVMSDSSAVSDSVQRYGQQPTRLLCPQDSLGKNTGVGCHVLLQNLISNLTGLWSCLLRFQFY